MHDIQGYASRIDEYMRARSILILASVATIVIVAGMGNAFAYTWNNQCDVTQLTSSNTAQWYAYISTTGSTSVGDYVSWCNGLNHAASGVGSVMPAVYNKENMDNTDWIGNTIKNTWSPISYGQCWTLFDYTSLPVQSDSADHIGVMHKYFDSSGTRLLASTTLKNHYYTF